MLDLSIAVLYVLIFCFIICTILCCIKWSDKKKELDLNWNIQECNLKDNFRTLEGCITSE